MDEKIIAKQNFLGRLIFREKYLQLKDSRVNFQPSQLSIRVDALQDFATVTSLPWGNRVAIFSSGKKYTIGFLLKSDSEIIVNAINKIFAATLEVRILGVLKYFRETTEKTYLRDSQIPNLQLEVLSLLIDLEKSYDSLNKYLSADLIHELSALKTFLPIESNAEELRANYEANVQSEYANFFSTVEKNPLSQQQCLAAIRDNDYNLILAGAGTGKTSVIIAKALFLQKSGQAKASDILILAYNNEAANELRKRYELRAEAIGFATSDIPKIKTFHALGLDILKLANEDISLSKLPKDKTKLLMWVTQWLGSYIANSETGLPDFIKILYEPVNPFAFETREEYERHLRDNEYRTFQGELVKSYQEVLIANGLFEHSIKYEYEPQYQTKVRIEIGIDYRPDFYLPEFDLYIEHFGVDRSGKTRAGIDAKKYAEEMEKKRLLHQEQGTHLIETYHYEWCEDNLLDSLKQKLQKSILRQNRYYLPPNTEPMEIHQEVDPALWEPIKRSQDEILNTLNEMGIVSEKAELLLDCLKAIRVENIQEDSVLNRLEVRKVGFPEIWSKILNKLVGDYLSELKRTKTIDFDDMIIRATEIIRSRNYDPKWTHVLVDEFQDISNARMNLVKEIVSTAQKPSLAVVGDDWQAIYRFAGGKLELTTRFEKLVGKSTTSKLETTYRYNDNIAHIAGTFVMQNPEQYVKTISSPLKTNSPRVFLLDEGLRENSSLMKKVSMTIATLKENAPGESVAVLARYNYLLEECHDQNRRAGIKNIKYWTFHKSKGLEADNCILIGFFQGRSGFPNYRQDAAVKEALLPLEDPYLHSEERRLLYVALTRAKNRSYLIADARAPSEFILELLSPKYGLRIVSEKFKERYRRMFKCPNCSSGHFLTRNGPHGEFYSCSTGPSCKIKPRLCSKCGAPSLDNRESSICNNPECKHSMKICPKCGRPLRLREGRFGKFWGCSGYGVKDDKCSYTTRHRLNSKQRHS